MREIWTLLFVDDHHMGATRRVCRVFEQPRKFGPVLVPDCPWEAQCVIVYGSVLPDPAGSGFQMWYQSYDRSKNGPDRAHNCYAVSEDGVHWEKPELGILEFRGSRQNNIIAKGLGSLNVIVDHGDPNSEHRYKMLFTGANAEGPGLFAAFSPDGIHWQVGTERVIDSVSDRTTLLFDPELKAPFVGFTRRHGKDMQAEFGRRIIYRIESEDFAHWSEPTPLLVPDLADSWDVQFYGMPAFRYRDLYLGGLKRLWSTPDRIDTELVWSRDTRSWGRTRVSFLENGPSDSWDSSWVGLASSPPLEVGGQLFFYFEGRRQAHGQRYPFPQGSIGLAVLPRDRFAAIEAGPAEGYVETKPFKWHGGRLGVNLRTNGHGYLRVALLDEDGNEMSGFTASACTSLTGDVPCAEPSWGTQPPRELIGRNVRLRIHMVNTRLYAVYALAAPDDHA